MAPGILFFSTRWSWRLPSARSRKPTPSPSQGSPLQWVAWRVSPPRLFSLVLHRELKGTAGGPAMHCQGFSCTLTEQRYCSETVPPNSFKLGAGLFYSSFSFACEALVAVAGGPFSLPSHQDMRLSRSAPRLLLFPRLCSPLCELQHEDGILGMGCSDLCQVWEDTTGPGVAKERKIQASFLPSCWIVYVKVSWTWSQVWALVLKDCQASPNILHELYEG